MVVPVSTTWMNVWPIVSVTGRPSPSKNRVGSVTEGARLALGAKVVAAITVLPLCR